MGLCASCDTDYLDQQNHGHNCHDVKTKIHCCNSPECDIPYVVCENDWTNRTNNCNHNCASNTQRNYLYSYHPYCAVPIIPPDATIHEYNNMHPTFYTSNESCNESCNVSNRENISNRENNNPPPYNPQATTNNYSI